MPNQPRGGLGPCRDFGACSFPGVEAGHGGERSSSRNDLRLVWGSFWAGKSQLTSLQRGQEGEPGASSTPSPPWLHLWHVNFSLCTLKLKLIPGVAASRQSLSATCSILQPCPQAAVPNFPVSILRGRSLPEKPRIRGRLVASAARAAQSSFPSRGTVTIGCCTYSCTE